MAAKALGPSGCAHTRAGGLPIIGPCHPACLFLAARRIAEHEGLEEGYRLIVNCKRHGGQEVDHLHMHLLGGEPLGPMRQRDRRPS